LIGIPILQGAARERPPIDKGVTSRKVLPCLLLVLRLLCLASALADGELPQEVGNVIGASLDLS
jgi:hypothetical protein